MGFDKRLLLRLVMLLIRAMRYHMLATIPAPIYGNDQDRLEHFVETSKDRKLATEALDAATRTLDLICRQVPYTPDQLAKD